MVSIALVLTGFGALAARAEYRVLTAEPAAPTVMVVAVDSSRGVAPRVALEQIATWKLTAGKLVLVLDQPRYAPRTKRPSPRFQVLSDADVDTVLAAERPDYLLILDEDYDFRAEVPAARGRTIALNGVPNGLVDVVATALNAANEGPDWTVVPQRRAGDEVHEGRATLRITTAAKNERKGERVALRARQHRQAVAVVLETLGLLDAERAKAAATHVFGPQQRLGPRVAIFDDDGAVSSSGHDPLWLVRSLQHLPLEVTVFDAVDVANGALARCDVVVFGGGSARRQGLVLGETGRERVRAFVRDGGGYVGLCAGAFLASTSRDRYLGLLDFDVDGTSGSRVLELTWNADLVDQHGITGTRPTKFSNGPLIEIDELGPGVDVWATFAADLPREERDPLRLKGTAAAVAGAFGDGRVVAFSPHLERDPGPQQAFWNALFWTTGMDHEIQRARGVQTASAD